MKLPGTTLAAFVFLAGLLILPGMARAGELPSEATLNASSAVSWPDQPGFEYRLQVKAGEQGADFNLSFPHPHWELGGVDGTFLALDDASLDGPGELSVVSTLVADPMPTACFRGGFGSPLDTYNLTLAPGEETTVIVPASLLAAPLAGMNASITASLSIGGAEPLKVNAPLEIGGTEGVRIQIDSNRQQLKSWQRFTLTGQTFPALSHRWLQVRAEPRLWNGEGDPPRTQVVLTVRTDKDGHFRSRPVHLGREASWVLTSKLLKSGRYDGGSSCNGVVETKDGWYRPSWIDLKDFTFVSTKVKGRNLGVLKFVRRDGSVRYTKKRRLRLSFSLSPRFSFNIPDSRDWPLVPSISPDTGCNRMGGEVSVRNGIIKADRSFVSTAMLCLPDHDSWITGLLTKGLKAVMKNRTLILERGKTKIVLKRRY